jgi:hypothetical protein
VVRWRFGQSPRDRRTPHAPTSTVGLTTGQLDPSLRPVVVRGFPVDASHEPARCRLDGLARLHRHALARPGGSACLLARRPLLVAQSRGCLPKVLGGRRLSRPLSNPLSDIPRVNSSPLATITARSCTASDAPTSIVYGQMRACQIGFALQLGRRGGRDLLTSAGSLLAGQLSADREGGAGA